MDFEQLANILFYFTIITACFWGYLSNKGATFYKKWNENYDSDVDNKLSSEMWKLYLDNNKIKGRVAIIFWVLLFLSLFISGNFTDIHEDFYE